MTLGLAKKDRFGHEDTCGAGGWMVEQLCMLWSKNPESMEMGQLWENEQFILVGLKWIAGKKTNTKKPKTGRGE